MAMTALLLVASLLLLPTTGQAQEMTIRRRLAEAAAHPHGLPFESPLALSPAAYEFFHPRARAQLAGAAAGAPGLAPRGQPRGAGLSAASVARADHEEGGVAPPAGRPGVRRGGSVRAGVFAGAAVVVLAALGLAYAVARRRVGVAHGGGDAEAEAEADSAGAAKSSA